jgi:hypothetical protein
MASIEIAGPPHQSAMTLLGDTDCVGYFSSVAADRRRIGLDRIVYMDALDKGPAELIGAANPQIALL